MTAPTKPRMTAARRQEQAEREELMRLRLLPDPLAAIHGEVMCAATRPNRLVEMFLDDVRQLHDQLVGAEQVIDRVQAQRNDAQRQNLQLRKALAYLDAHAPLTTAQKAMVSHVLRSDA